MKLLILFQLITVENMRKLKLNSK